MKTILILIVTALISGYTYAQDFSRYENKPGVSAVVINKKMFKLMSKFDLDSDDEEIQSYIKLIENLEDIKIFKTTNPDMRKALNEDAEAYISGNNLEELMRANEDGKFIRFMFKPGNTDDEIKQLFIHVNGIESEEDTLVMIISGLIDLRQISKLTRDLKVPGADSIKEKQ